MEIFLFKPEGRREGPYTLEQINRDLAAGRYVGTDYWAWHEGLPEWIPLYSLPGIQERLAPAAPEAGFPSGPEGETSEPAAAPTGTSSEPSATEVTEGDPSALAADKIPSGMAFAALEQIFILTSGEGRAASGSPITASMLEKITGEELQTIRQQVPRDVIGHCELLQGLKGQSSTPGAVWPRMASLRPELLQQAREGTYRICIRNFRIDNDDVVSVFLFYNKQKL